MFQNGDDPPSCICYVHVWTTRDEYLVVFIIMQNLVAVDAIASIICKCWCLTCLAQNTYSRFQRFFCGILPLNGSSHIATPKRHFLVQKHVIRH